MSANGYNTNNQTMYDVDAREYQMFLCWKNRVEQKMQRMNYPQQQQQQYQQKFNNSNSYSKPINPALLTPPPMNLPNCGCPSLPYNPAQTQYYQKPVPSQYMPYGQQPNWGYNQQYGMMYARN